MAVQWAAWPCDQAAKHLNAPLSASHGACSACPPHDSDVSQGPHELVALCAALKHLTHLRLLNMSDNFVDDNTITEVVEACLPMKSLQVCEGARGVRHARQWA